MIAPLSWLREYVDIDCTPQELEEKLFSCGFEVENLEEVGARISRVVVGLVTSCEPIEGTHLHLCEVDCGSEGKFQICCGADNVEAGKKFPTALVGATVCETNKERTEIVGTATIQAGKLRGYDSFGMLCSGMELGLNEDLYPGAGYNGLLVLPDDAIPGADVKPIVGLDDWLFDIAITANRPDCQGIYGIAREVAAVLGKEMKPLPLSYREEKTEPHTLQVEVEAPQYCPRYEAHAVKDVKIAPSPAWLRRRLSLVGVSAISNMVDITNYVMLELGQPMHAFDRCDLAGDRIVVRTAKAGEKLVTLDEQELTLTESNLLICDGEKPVGLAGIMGGLNSEIKDTTTAVVFEAAKFARDNIRRSARALGKRTDASAHFEKGTDEYTVELAMQRALHLTEELGAGTVTDECAGKNTGNSIEKRPLTVSLARVNGVLGIKVPGEDVCRILANLDMEPELEGDALRLKIPAYREDMESYQDVAEEVIRFYGYEHIVPSFLKSAEVTSGGLNERQRRELKLKETLAGGGMYEAIHYSFFSPADLKLFRYPEGSEALRAIRILNPISEELSLMRTVLSPSMANAVMRNQKAGNLSGRLFELAKVFIPKSLPLTDYPEERAHLAFAFFGKEESFFTLKGALDLAAESLHVKFRYEASTEPFTHPYQTAGVYVGEVKVGYLGKLAYDIAGELNLRTDAYLAELDLDTIESLPHEPVYFTPLPKFPEVQRDLALVMDKAISCEQVVNLIQGCNPLIREVKLFDVYEGAPIPPTKKSLAFTLTFRPEEKAFTPEELDKLTQEILEKLKTSCDIALRV